MRARLNGVSYCYDVQGEGEALLLLHGFTGSKDTWSDFVPRWSKRNSVISVDLIGHGQTESPADYSRYEMEKVAEDMVALLDFLQVEKAHMLGYSLGGRLAISIATLYPERLHSLILESTTAGVQSEEEREKRRQQDFSLADEIETKGMESFVQYWENMPLFATQKTLPLLVQERVREERLRQNELGLGNSLRGMGAGAQLSYWEQLKHFSCPVLILYGEMDKKFCDIAWLMEKELKNVEVEKFVDTGHALHLENPERFARVVKAWLVEALQTKI